MKAKLILALLIVATISTSALAIQIDQIAWNESHVATLRSFDKAAISAFVTGGDRDPGFREKNILEFGWYDLAGDGKYELALTQGGGPCCVFLVLYRQDSIGKVSSQSFDGAGRLSKTIRDLNGDGQQELILYSYVGSENYQGTTPQAMWPEVYRLKGTKYVEASRDFPAFYHDEILPLLANQIDDARRMAASGSQDNEEVAVLKMEKDKILRVIDGDATAGLQQARTWANSSDPQLIGDAVVVFRDIGGYEDEARAAEAAFKVAQHRVHNESGGRS